MLPKIRQRELSDLAEFIADLYCPNEEVSPEYIADSIGLSFSYGDYAGCFDGLLEHEFGTFHVYINDHGYRPSSNPRLRFSFAHELGHYYIDDHRNALRSGRVPSHPSRSDFTSKNPVEMEADFFAASLLMPRGRLIQDCLKQKFSFQLIERISQKYNTSITATLLKFASIGNHPIMVVCFRDNQITWKTFSSDFPYIRIKDVKGAPPLESLAARFYASGFMSKEPEELVADDWFSGLFEYKRENPIYEKCVYAPKSNFVLSVIWED